MLFKEGEVTMGWLKKIGKKILEGSCCCTATEESCCGTDNDEEIKDSVRKNYADLITSPRRKSCCGSESTAAELAGYTDDELEGVPEEIRETTFGCGNPVALAGLREGDVVLDIGSGAGMDAILAGRKVGSQGKVIGLDMTPEMIEAARKNTDSSGVRNVEFRLGDADSMPVEDNSCDWIISNCVINLAPDKTKVFGEAFRVLRLGGRLMISDIVTHDLPPEIRQNMDAWAGCVGGALEEEEYIERIREAGFQSVEVTAKMTYDEGSIRAMGESCCSGDDGDEPASALPGLAPKLAGRISSVSVRAVKPEGGK